MKLYREVDADDTDYEIKAVKEYKLPTEEEIRGVLSKRTRTYVERDNESGEQYPILAVPSHLFRAIARDIRNLLKGER